MEIYFDLFLILMLGIGTIFLGWKLVLGNGDLRKLGYLNVINGSLITFFVIEIIRRYG